MNTFKIIKTHFNPFIQTMNFSRKVKPKKGGGRDVGLYPINWCQWLVLIGYRLGTKIGQTPKLNHQWVDLRGLGGGKDFHAIGGGFGTLCRWI